MRSIRRLLSCAPVVLCLPACSGPDEAAGTESPELEADAYPCEFGGCEGDVGGPSGPGGPGGPYCGDGSCEVGESCESCPGDCGECAPSCGDGICNGAELCSTCPGDCGACPPTCGDGTCNGAELCSSCPADCGACPPSCGDGSCNGTEVCSSCPADCGACTGAPDLAPVQTLSTFCARNAPGNLVVKIANQGSSAAGASVVRVSFASGGFVDTVVPALAAGAQQSVYVPMPAACFDCAPGVPGTGTGHCSFTIQADAQGTVVESNEANNVSTNAMCPGG